MCRTSIIVSLLLGAAPKVARSTVESNVFGRRGSVDTGTESVTAFDLILTAARRVLVARGRLEAFPVSVYTVQQTVGVLAAGCKGIPFW